MANKPKTNRAGDITAVSGYDICQTPPHALEPLYPLLVGFEGIIWESAVGPEHLLETALLDHGYAVIGTDLLMGDKYNFFNYEPPVWTMQITNVPFSIKYEWIQRSFELGKPFALLVPYETTFAAAFTTVAKQYHNRPWPIEVLKPERRINYKMPNTGWGITEWDEAKGKMVRRGDSAQMPTAWLTWGLNAGSYYTEYLRTYEVPMRSVKYNNDNTEKI